MADPSVKTSDTARSTPVDPGATVDFGDMQGLLRFGHGHLDECAFLLLRIRDPAAAARWLDQADFTSASALDEPPGSVLQVAFSAQGLLAMGLNREIVDEFSEEFNTGMSGDNNRSRRLGDVGANDPIHWRWGGTGSDSIHLLLMCYAAEGQLDAHLAFTGDVDFGRAFERLQTLESRNAAPEEPFGFADGISQPKVDWSQTVSTDPHDRAAYGNLMAVGELVLGYRNEYGLYTARPLLNPAATVGTESLPRAPEQSALRDLGRNGTYLVLRQLSQDVRGFWHHLDQATGGDASRREELAAAMVGRRRDGTPLVGRASRPIPGVESGRGDNEFTFDDDPHGRQCPIGSHIRRANPRTGDMPPRVSGLLQRLLRTLGFGRRFPEEDLVASTRFHRILRRGRVYGDRLTQEEVLADTGSVPAEQGLLFVCLGANISRQFEFVQGAWLASSKFAGLPTESDPLLGSREPLLDGSPTDRFSRPREGAPACIAEGLPRFVTVRGGAYFFMPGLRALEFIVQQAIE